MPTGTYACPCFLNVLGVELRSTAGAGDLARELEGVPDTLAELDASLLAGTAISTTGNDLRRFESVTFGRLNLTSCEVSLLLLLLSGGPKNRLTKFNIIYVVRSLTQLGVDRTCPAASLCAGPLTVHISSPAEEIVHRETQYIHTLEEQNRDWMDLVNTLHRCPDHVGSKLQTRCQCPALRKPICKSQSPLALQVVFNDNLSARLLMLRATCTTIFCML